MKKIHGLVLAAAAALFVLPSTALARSAPIVTFDDIAIVTPDGRSLTLEQVQRAVLRAVSSTRQWVPSSPKPNTVRATYSKGRHSAVIDVVFTETSYSIKYVDSTDLNYSDKDGRAVIHPVYNKAVTTLRQSIDAALRTAT
jgi:hypothetical protein